MRDADVRSALRMYLDEQHGDDPETLTVDELALCGQVRIDVAVVNGSLAGYELKSERDTLRRLPNQASVYSRVFDEVTLVVARKHSDAAAPIVPTWWGLSEAHMVGDTVHLEMTRPPAENPVIDPRWLVRLLWRDEALAALETHGLAKGIRSKPRTTLWERLAAELPLSELRSVVRESLKVRTGWRVGQ